MALTATELGCAKSSFEPSIILVTVQLAQTGQVYAAMWKVLFPTASHYKLFGYARGWYQGQSALRAGSGVDLISVRIGISCLAVSVFVVQFVVPVYRRCILLLAVERPCQPSTENIVESGGMPSREEGGPPPRHEHSSETAQEDRSENRPLWSGEPSENDGKDRRTPVDRSRMTAVHHVGRRYDQRHSPCSNRTNRIKGGHGAGSA